MQAALALPSTGGAVSATLSASPTCPVIAFFFARGWTRTWNEMARTVLVHPDHFFAPLKIQFLLEMLALR